MEFELSVSTFQLDFTNFTKHNLRKTPLSQKTFRISANQLSKNLATGFVIDMTSCCGTAAGKIAGVGGCAPFMVYQSFFSTSC